MVRMSLF